MKNKKFLFLFLSALMLIMTPNANAKSQKSGGMRWSSRQNFMGLYGRNFNQSSHTIAFTIAPAYYAGDVELQGNPLNGYKDFFKDPSYQPVEGKNSFMNNVGAVGAIYYAYRQNSFIAYRAQLMGGWLHGYCDFLRVGDDGYGNPETHEFEREMKSIMMEYSFGVEFYPIPSAGLFIYAGVGGVTSYITRNFNPYLASVNPALNVNDKLWSTVPVIPVGAGYKYTHEKFTIGVEVIWHPALIDQKGANMDGWESGYKHNGYEYYPTKKDSNKWADSFAHLGVTFAYTISAGTK